MADQPAREESREHSQRLTIAVVTAFYKRHRMTRLMMRHARTMVTALQFAGVDLKLVAVGSQRSRSRRVARSEGWDYCEADNMPLSDKFNAGVKHARALHPWVDAVIIMGSDDFASLQCYINASIMLRDGADYIIPNGLHFYCTRTRRAIYLGSHTTGTFRVLSRKLLESLDWEPYYPGALSGIDRAMTDKVREQLGSDRFSKTGAARLLNTNPGSPNVLLDVKTGDNMHSFERMAASITSRFVSLDVLEHFGSTGVILRDFVPWMGRRRMLRSLTKRAP